MEQDNVMEFCQWLMTEKGIEAGELSDYINNNEAEVLGLAKTFKAKRFKVGGKVEAAAEKFKCGGKAKKIEKAQDGEKISRKEYKEQKQKRSDVKRAAKQNFGFNNAQFQTSYENAKYGFANQGLSRRDAKLAAQRALMNKPSVDVAAPVTPFGLNRNMNIDRSVVDRLAEGLEINTAPVQPKAAASPRAVEATTMQPADTTIYDAGLINDVVIKPQAAAANSYVVQDEPAVINQSSTGFRAPGMPGRFGLYNGPTVTKSTSREPLLNRIIDWINQENTSEDSESNSNGFRTKTMPGRFGLARYNQKGGVVKAQGGKRFGVKLGNTEYNEFNSEHGKYERVAFPKDTVWAYEPITGGERYEVYTTPDGYKGTYTNVYGNVDPISLGDTYRLRNRVEDTLNPDKVRQAIIDRNWDETLMPENKIKLDKMRYLVEMFQKDPKTFSPALEGELYRQLKKKQ